MRANQLACQVLAAIANSATLLKFKIDNIYLKYGKFKKGILFSCILLKHKIKLNIKHISRQISLEM